MRTLVRLFAIAIHLALIATVAFGWGNVTHVYLAKQVNAKYGIPNLNEMYGSLLPDTYNLLFDEKGQYLYQALHTNFMPFYDNANTGVLKSVAVGFVSHNVLWGADYTAHEQAFTTPAGGYAVVKGNALAPQLVPVLTDILVAAGLPVPDAGYVAELIAPEMGHDLVEAGVDILVRRNLDPAVGMRMAAAARARPGTVGTLLAATYAPGLAQATGMSLGEAELLITQGEADYAEQMAQYGLLFSIPENLTIRLLSQQIAPIAAEFIKANVGVEVVISPDLVATFVRKAIAIVSPDYAMELRRTLAKVEDELASHAISGPSGILGKENVAATETAEPPVPSATELMQNFPNPFNPTTTVAFTLPYDSHVSVKIFNLLGEEVAVLVDELRNAGYHTVVWDAGKMPSGIYVYRIDAGGVQQTRKMSLVR